MSTNPEQPKAWKPRSPQQRAEDRAKKEEEENTRRRDFEELRLLKESIKNAMKKLDDATEVLADENPTEISSAESAELVCMHVPIMILDLKKKLKEKKKEKLVKFGNNEIKLYEIDSVVNFK
jgi:pyruvate/2-oxoacid:ferredoxin oxidoreductase alpha subunit